MSGLRLKLNLRRGKNRFTRTRRQILRRRLGRLHEQQTLTDRGQLGVRECASPVHVAAGDVLATCQAMN